MPAISVIIPTYKHRDYVLQTLDSVFAQTFTDYEVIVVNDGSPDDTAEALRPLAESGRIRYIEQANAGQSSARNRGMAEAQGEFIALLDDDDLWPPDKLERQIELLHQNPHAVLVYGKMRGFSDAEEYIWPEAGAPHGNVLQAFLERCWISSPGQSLIRAEALHAVGGFDPDIWGADDWDIYIRLARQGEFCFEDVVALHYRVHSNNASKNVWRMYSNACKVTRKHFALLEANTSGVKWRTGSETLRDHFHGQALTIATKHIQQKQWKKARPLLLTAIRIRPNSLLKRYVAGKIARCILGPLYPGKACE